MRPEPQAGHHPADRGFTLLETLVALAILGVVLAALFRLAGDTLVQHRAREARLGLALTAEAAFNAERLEPGSAAGYSWPEAFTVSVERRDFAGVETLEGLGALTATLADDLDWLSVRVVDGDGRAFALEGAVGRASP